MVVLIWVDPLTVEVYTSRGVTVIATQHSVRVQTRNQNESVVSSQQLRFLAIARKKVKHSFKNQTCRRLTTVDSTSDQNNRFLPKILCIPCDNNLPKRDAANRTAKFLPSVVNELIFVFKSDSRHPSSLFLHLISLFRVLLNLEQLLDLAGVTGLKLVFPVENVFHDL